MGALPIQFSATVSGTTLTLVMSSVADYGATVTNYDATLSYSTDLATYIDSVAPSGFQYAANPTSGMVRIAGSSTDGVAPGTTLATFTFTLNMTTSDFPLTLTNVGLNNDAFVNGTADPSVPCFVKGTLIATADGETAVEELHEGDLLRTIGGSLQAVCWIGQRKVASGLHPRPHDIMPIRILAGAFGVGRPARDLRLSPDHAVFIDGVLIPVRYLLNDATIRQELTAWVHYFHIELNQHDVILADGLPTESYLDTGNRKAFGNNENEVALHPDFAMRVWETAACAPLVRSGVELEAARSYLLERAKEIGYTLTSEPNLRVIADGREVWPLIIGRRYRFCLPTNASAVILVSRNAVPAHTHDASLDHRHLGVAVSRIALDGQNMTLTDERVCSGWHDVEHDTGVEWRWTNGAGIVDVEAARVLDIDVELTERYWAEVGPFQLEAASQTG